jgi:hypothetical protein
MMRLGRSFQISVEDSHSFDVIRSLYCQQLKMRNFLASNELGIISFRKTVNIEFPSYKRGKVFIIFREGKISISSGINRINVDWSVKLDILYFLSILSGLFFCLVMNLYLDLSLSLTLVTGVLGTVAALFTGIVLMLLKIDEINSACFNKLKER